MDERYAAVVAVLSIYFDGLYHSDSGRLERVFHPLAHYVTATEGEVLQMTMAQYFSIVDNRPSPAGRGEARNDRILSVDFAGPVTAFAKVECSIGPKFFTDFLTLIYVDDGWNIISKVFHYDLRL